MYDSVLHNDTGVNRKLPQPQSATRLPPPEGGGLRSGAVQEELQTEMVLVERIWVRRRGRHLLFSADQ